MKDFPVHLSAYFHALRKSSLNPAIPIPFSPPPPSHPLEFPTSTAGTGTTPSHQLDLHTHYPFCSVPAHLWQPKTITASHLGRLVLLGSQMRISPLHFASTYPRRSRQNFPSSQGICAQTLSLSPFFILQYMGMFFLSSSPFVFHSAPS